MGAVIGIIPARFGSTRFKGKPLAPILGKPLIQHTFENAQLCSQLDRLMVATDHPDIADAVAGFGGEAVMTSPNCTCGTDRLAEVVDRVLDGAKGSILVNIQGDWPCMNPSVITEVVNALKTDWSADIGTAAVPITAPQELDDPHIVKCALDQSGRALYFTRTPIPGGYAHLGIYSYRPDFLQRFSTLPPTPLEQAEDLEQLRALEHGYKIKVAVVDQARVLSVDRPQDLATIEEYLCNRSICLSREASSPLSAKG